MTDGNFKDFAQGYMTCALWSSTQCDEEGNNCTPLDDEFGVDDIDPASKAEHEAECRDFVTANAHDLDRACKTIGYTWSRAGHDFWLTRCGHGAGFWDRGLGDVGDELSNAAKLCGGRDPYVGDNGRVYLS